MLLTPESTPELEGVAGALVEAGVEEVVGGLAAGVDVGAVVGVELEEEEEAPLVLELLVAVAPLDSLGAPADEAVLL